MQKSVPAQTTRHAQRVYARQQVLLHTVVGSLVLCAVFGATASAQQSARQTQEAQPVFEFRPIHDAPLRDVLAETRAALVSGQLSAQDKFEFVIEAERAEDGTLHDVTFTKTDASNPRWQELAREFVAALNESYALQPLKGVNHLSLAFKLDDAAAASMTATADTTEHATQLANGYNVLLAVGRAAERERDGVEVLNNMTFSASGKRLSMKLELTREQVGNLLRQHLSIP
jgi:hypothetical protein